MTNNNEPKLIITEDKTKRYVWEGKLHNWDGPSIIYSNGKKEYYLHGMPLTEKEWKARRKERSGLPWFKQSGTNARQ